MSHQVNSAWENLNKTWRERVERLEEAMQAAVQFQDGLQVFEESSLKQLSFNTDTVMSEPVLLFLW